MLKDIEGFEMYQISDTGEVYSKYSNKTLKPIKDKDGYLQVKLYKDKKQYTRKLHRLVAEAFLDNPDNKPEVNHKNLDKTNNHVSNLEWATRAENCHHQSENGHVVQPHNVYRIYRYGEFVEECVGYENTFKRLLMSSAGFTNMLKTGRQNRQGFSVTLV